jgi:hypothetical protein
MSNPPPAYTSPAVDDAADNAELEALIASLSDLDVATLSGPQSPAPPAPTGRETPPPSRISPPVTPQRHNPRLYEFHSPTKSGFTMEW